MDVLTPICGQSTINFTNHFTYTEYILNINLIISPKTERTYETLCSFHHPLFNLHDLGTGRIKVVPYKRSLKYLASHRSRKRESEEGARREGHRFHRRCPREERVCRGKIGVKVPGRGHEELSATGRDAPFSLVSRTGANRCPSESAVGSLCF